MSELTARYFDYIESYLNGFYQLYKLKNNHKFFYPLCFIYVDFMELWIKTSIMCYDGFPEKWTINQFQIGTHDFELVLKNEKTISEFLFLGITNGEINSILIEIEEIKNKVGTNDLSFAFRYPCDKDNNFYMKKFSEEEKNEIINLMFNNIKHSLNVFLKCTSGINGLLLQQIKILKEYNNKFYN